MNGTTGRYSQDSFAASPDVADAFSRAHSEFTAVCAPLQRVRAARITAARNAAQEKTLASTLETQIRLAKPSVTGCAKRLEVALARATTAKEKHLASFEKLLEDAEAKGVAHAEAKARVQELQGRLTHAVARLARSQAAAEAARTEHLEMVRDPRLRAQVQRLRELRSRAFASVAATAQAAAEPLLERAYEVPPPLSQVPQCETLLAGLPPPSAAAWDRHQVFAAGPLSSRAFPPATLPAVVYPDLTPLSAEDESPATAPASAEEALLARFAHVDTLVDEDGEPWPNPYGKDHAALVLDMVHKTRTLGNFGLEYQVMALAAAYSTPVAMWARNASGSIQRVFEYGPEPEPGQQVRHILMDAAAKHYTQFIPDKPYTWGSTAVVRSLGREVDHGGGGDCLYHAFAHTRCKTAIGKLRSATANELQAYFEEDNGAMGKVLHEMAMGRYLAYCVAHA